MEFSASSRKKTGAGRIVGGIFLCIFLLILLLIGLIILGLYTSPQQYDEVKTLIHEPAMPAASRYRFSAADQSMTLLVDKTDLLWIADQPDTALSIRHVEAALDTFGFTLERYGLTLPGNGSCRLTLLFSALDERVFVPATLSFTPYVDNGDICLALDTIRFSWLPPLPVSLLAKNLTGGEDTLRVEAASVHPLLKNLYAIEPDGDRFRLSLPVDTLLYQELLPSLEPALSWRMFTELPLGVSAALDELEHGNVINYAGEPQKRVLGALEADPAWFAAYRRDILACGTYAASEAFFNSAFAPYRMRFLPELTPEGTASVRDGLYAEAKARSDLLQTLSRQLLAAWEKGALLYDGTRFVSASAPQAEFVLSSLADTPAAFDGWFDIGSARLVFGYDLGGYAASRSLSPAAMPKTPGTSTKRLSADGLYLPVIIGRMMDGSGAVFYLDEADALYINRLSDADFAALLADEGVPVVLADGRPIAS